MTMHHLVRAAAIGAVVSVVSVLTAAQQPSAQGETWEQTIQMSMLGMNMPTQTATVCQVKSAERTPPKMEDGCTMTDLQTTGSRVAFNVACTKPQPMTGTGEFLYDGENSYSGTMTMKSSDGTMVMKMAGKRIGAACDPGALGRQIAAQGRETDARLAEMQRQSGQELAKACAEQAAAGSPALFMSTAGTPAVCTDSTVLCGNFRTQAGFAKVSSGPMLKMMGEVCKVDPAVVRADLCGTALKNESLNFLASSCPDQSKVLVQRECAGRKFTSDVSAKYQSFCASYFASTLESGGDSAAAPAAPKPADAKPAAVDEAKKKIRGIFGR
jgi:hypothetical protein